MAVFSFPMNSVSARALGRSSNTNSADVRIAGIKELAEGLLKMPAELEKKAVWAALSAAGVVVKNAAVEKAPELQEDTPNRRRGTVKRAIRVSRSKFEKGQGGRFGVIIRVKPLKGRQVMAFKKKTGMKSHQNPDDPFYWWFVEFGTVKKEARPFLRPAFEETKSAQLEAMRKRMKAHIDRYARQIEQEVRRAA